jgi:hypothetical protein
LYYTESYSTFISRGPYTLYISDYPELEGKTINEIKEYISENASDMESPSEYNDNLMQYLSEMDVIKEKITDDDASIEYY